MCRILHGMSSVLPRTCWKPTTCLANKSALHSQHSSKMTRFWYFILVRKSIECQSSSRPRNAPFPQHRDFQIRSDVLSPPVSLSHYSYCLCLTFPSRHYGSPNRTCEGGGVDKLDTSSLLRRSAFTQVLTAKAEHETSSRHACQGKLHVLIMSRIV